ncbi:MAG: pyruvate kinase [Bacilli bacterium]|nr:pyruvate kinase [Bacilli bacterium]
MNYRIDKKTKIVCTIGPASQDKAMMKNLLKNGMTCMRMNFSHGSYEEQKAKIDTLREIEKEENIIIPICLDTKGPEIRTSDFEGGKADFVAGQETRIYMGVEKLGTAKAFGVTYKNLYEDVTIGSSIRLDDGNLLLKVLRKDEKTHEIVCLIENSHTCKSRRGVNVPGVHLSMPYLSEQDKNDLIFGCENHVDLVSASFVRNVQDIRDMRELLDAHGGKNIIIISKVENTEAIENLDDIIRESDGIMVARGDLAVEIPAEQVPYYQHYMIETCRKLGKPVITATQMLDSMIHNPFPTRAEVSDVYAAVSQGSDSVMLSGESANGDYPAEAVDTQARIAREAEKHYDYKHANLSAYETSDKGVSDAISAAVSDTALLINAKLIVTVSVSGNTAVRISKTRPVCPVFVVSSDRDTLSHMMLYYGCYPYFTKYVPQFTEEMEVLALKIAKDYNIPYGSRIILTGGTPVGAGKTNFIKVLTLNERGVVDED